MSLGLMSLILLGGLVLLLALGTEIGVAMAIMAATGMLFFVNVSLDQFAPTAFNVMNSFALTAVPLFVFMGALFANTGTIRSLFQGTEKFVGRLPGSMASAIIGANAIFGAMSGSSLAATATFGKIAYPEMERAGYDPRLALGAIVVSGTLSVLIPPSIIMVVYGAWLEVSVARLFAAGLIPGIILAALLMLTVTVLVKCNPSLAPKPRKFTWRERLGAIKEIGPFIGVIALVLGTIFAGIMTPTESAALGAFLSIILALAYRRMSFTALKESMWTAVTISAMTAFVVFTAKMLGHVFQFLGMTGAFATFMLGLNFDKFGMLVIISIMFILMGCFFDAFSMLVLTLPFMVPLITNLGIDFIWFGIFYVVLAQIGLITPPFGLNLFVLNNVVPQFDIITIFRGALPFLIPVLILIVILIAFPEIALWLPSILY